MIYKCKMCGAALNLVEGSTVCECEYCGSTQTVPNVRSDVTINLFNRANNLRLKNDFDKAESIYEKIVEEDDSNAEAHWGIVLCKYGIEYVDDPNTKTKIPTCHRTLFDPITTDPDYQACIDYSDSSQQTIYEKEAKAIDKIQKDILAIVKNEKPFDVFICYKETDENNKRTVDSVIANDIYYQLTQEGFKVFFAAITLEDKLGQEYEPYIFAALNSAKVMLSIGTKPEYFNSVWVKNEWSRFLSLMKTDRSKLLIPCYRDMDPYDLPEEFAHLQAQDMSKIGFINDVVRGIKKIIVKEEEVTVKSVVNELNNTVAISPMIKRAYLSLEDKDWESADNFAEKLLDNDPENAQAYLIKLLIDLKVSSIDELIENDIDFIDNPICVKVLRFADDSLKSKLINTENEILYKKALDKYQYNSKSKNDYLEVFRLFENLGDYKDSASLADEAAVKAETIGKDTIYNQAIELLNRSTKFIDEKSVKNVENAITLLSSIEDWRDSNIKIFEAKDAIPKIKSDLEMKERSRKRKKNLFFVICIVLFAAAAVFFFYSQFYIPGKIADEARVLFDNGDYLSSYEKYNELSKFSTYKEMALTNMNKCLYENTKSEYENTISEYENAVSKYENGDMQSAYEAFMRIGDVNNSKDYLKAIFFAKPSCVKVGDIVYFGSYIQHNNSMDRREDIEWIVLAKEENKALLISKQALDCQQYDTSGADTTWENCSLRKWMNNTFLNNAFTLAEQSKILDTNVSADKNPKSSTDPGKPTTDKVFLLSIEEAEKYFTTKASRQCVPTNYAIEKGAYISAQTTCWWWLRSSGDMSFGAPTVLDAGSIRRGENVNLGDHCVRPAFWIDLDS